MGILIGTDFNDGVRGIGPKKSLNLIKKHGSIEGIRAEGKVAIPEEFEDVRRIFLEPEISDDYSLLWGRVDQEAVRRILCDKHGFSVDRIDVVLERVAAKQNTRAQKNLDSWG
jgi:flap endonuclease-1